MMWIYFLFASIPISEAVTQPIGSSYEIAGFIRQDAEGSIYLVSQPDVKSCCLGKGKEVDIRLEGLTFIGAPPVHAIVVSGILEKERDQLVMKEGRILNATHSFSLWLLLFFGGAIVIYVLRRIVKF